MGPGAEADETAVPPAKAGKKKAAKAFWGRLAIGHFAAYPVCFLTAAGALPLAMIVKKAALMSPPLAGARSSIVSDVARDLKLSAIEAAQVEIVLQFAMWVCLAVFVLIHLAVLPWSFGAAAATRDTEQGTLEAKRGLRIFGVTMATIIVLVAVGGTAGWAWILTR